MVYTINYLFIAPRVYKLACMALETARSARAFEISEEKADLVHLFCILCHDDDTLSVSNEAIY
jgi:hypothetical protein